MKPLKIYKIANSASSNAAKLFSPKEDHFYWNQKHFQKNKLGDAVIFIDKYAGWVLWTIIQEKEIEAIYQQQNDTTSFTHNNYAYSVDKEFKKFVQFKLIDQFKIPKGWKWQKQIGNSETYDLWKPGISNIEDRIQKIDDLLRVITNGPRSKELRSYRALLEQQLGGEVDSIASDQPKQNPKDIVDHVHAYLQAKGYRFDYNDIANLFLSLKTKPFVILAGISGTGKTQLPRKFAEATGNFNYLTQVAVRPDWTDGSDLLGYVGLNNYYIPKELTKAIQKANDAPNYPHFFILDEMNLARVEHYFSDFLSVIETREKDGNLITTDPIIKIEALEQAINKSEFGGLSWPPNLYLIGTVNMDETTHQFSRKVLDRANSIEMSTVDLSWPDLASPKVEKLSGVYNDLLKTEYLQVNDLSGDQRKALDKTLQWLQSINKVLEEAALHFAYRVRDEIMIYLTHNLEYGLMDATTAEDYQIMQKILPRIQGSTERIKRVMVGLLNILEDAKINYTAFDLEDWIKQYDLSTPTIAANQAEANMNTGEEPDLEDDLSNEGVPSEVTATKKHFKYPRSARKLVYMIRRYEEDRFTSFW